ncbi:tRNA pseudouridine(13) synthase TruD [Thiohalobacter sp. IOR34]|uniref:tRNA pseudouridine(13) synthase TruD n=1 Tax=Thiohalobacter sp. IOR34 TaxID=3057176 RepID=UPI0025B2538E|nr:tRNA pseudouridine(13) synthase TruD [Thiohalobacter sp. IOR34]WJW76605.1 tRNA pseudouridine(13) synthase TruD [Thiohalobacter sp. IOR34]
MNGNETLPGPFGPPLGTAQIRCRPEDFRVFEMPPCEPDGAGEHAWLKLRKREQNTEWLARQIARLAGVRPRDVGFAGLKDRHAVTEQWFSVYLPGRPDPDWTALEDGRVEVLAATRHGRKLRRGALLGNRFELRLRDVAADARAVDARLEALRERGMPNYFGAQRFGRDGANLTRAAALFAGELRRPPRHQRALYLSAARSLLFNQVLAARIGQGVWDRCLPGDVLQLDRRRGRFRIEAVDEETRGRCERLEIHPTGPLCGRGPVEVEAEALALEQAALAGREDWIRGLERLGLEADRRALRVRIAGLVWEWAAADELWLGFELPAGSYATVLLEQLFRIEDRALSAAP